MVSGKRKLKEVERVYFLFCFIYFHIFLSELANVSDLQCLGEIDAILGKLQIDDSVFLLAVIQSSKVAVRAKSEKEIWKIERIAALPIDADYQVDVSYFGSRTTQLDKIKKSQIIKVLSGYKPPVPQPKVVDEILRLFNDNGDFYYETDGGDITNSLQRLGIYIYIYQFS